MIFRNKRVLVTGVCGTVGAGLVRQLASDESLGVAEVIGLDNNESALFFLDQQYTADDKIRHYVADIRDRDELNRHMSGIDIVFHAAALKHVILCEHSPGQAVQNNIIGIQNIIACAFDNSVKRVIFTSSDKAVNPTNVMGTSKLMGEKLITAANTYRQAGETVFASTRFGNVLGSSGSVVPVFHKQIASGGPITLTDPGMTRFVMSLEQSVRLVLDTAELAFGGEVFVTKMPVIRIVDLATTMVKMLAPAYGHDPAAININNIGSKPGEKLYEELMSSDETSRAVELPDYFSVLPAFRDEYKKVEYNYADLVSDNIDRPYISSDEPFLSINEIETFMNQHKVLGPVPGF
ncbi:MAG: polysaccharide biosynthesis protein [Cyclobacteriaceae bacterium]|nr:polysaccharide biosynthesis protein [Cyclobacteriaceae bacterium]